MRTMHHFVAIAGFIIVIADVLHKPHVAAHHGYSVNHLGLGFSSVRSSVANTMTFLPNYLHDFFGGGGGGGGGGRGALGFEFPERPQQPQFGGDASGQFHFPGSFMPPRVCPALPQGPCAKSRYRTMDGSCNNLRNPAWGTPNTPYGRVQPPKYSDGINEPARSVVSGNELPGARVVSTTLFPEDTVHDMQFSLGVMQWGQVITHDMSLAAGTAQAKPHSTACCASDKSHPLDRQSRDPDCLPIDVPADDVIAIKTGVRCMNFVRTTTDMQCSGGGKPADQLVEVTHYMDLSIIYGSSLEQSFGLREFQGGLLRAEYRNGHIYLPQAENASVVCAPMVADEPCYMTGDTRVNQNPQLAVYHILMMREHNRLASILAKLNPHWNDERVFQEARRINIAQYQHINFYEYLPIILGRAITDRHGLTLNTRGYSEDYDPTVNPSTINVHSTASFRFFHSNIAGFLALVGAHRHAYSQLRLSDHFNRPEVIERADNFDNLIRGLASQPQMASDTLITSEVTQFMFRNGQPFGVDLRAIDIQRGRDHGLASYNDYREYCRLPRAHRFEDFQDLIDPEFVRKLALLYEHPDDVDIVVGGFLERLVPGALTGPTYTCLLTEQFHRTRAGDRFFFENGERPHGFNLEQLQEIRKASISRIYCDNGDNIQLMQPRGFVKITHDNPVVPCDSYEDIPVVNLEAWREVPHSFKK